LGISNLTQVRAVNLLELIYKGGNAGVTKATVSITFDNSDENQCPAGYQDYDEITVTRQVCLLCSSFFPLYLSVIFDSLYIIK
jgi:structural maintenance of chromosome 2